MMAHPCTCGAESSVGGESMCVCCSCCGWKGSCVNDKCCMYCGKLLTASGELSSDGGFCESCMDRAVKE